ncbi:HIRAN domain-containing protein [Paractinoplanes globisporus]|uniref:HIRAN domain-containing protein n=1 Tax=Paractinoplanes globisporus TaxID=113565 RepID=A0ABW6WPQ5_9ACTN|nr:HIRAN domain-containing protein [Actinoplanes globisporus]
MSIPFDLWGQRGWASVDVVGESHYQQSIRTLFDADLKGDGAELTTTVQLVPDPKNKFDRNAVGVWVGPRQLGHLSRDEAVRYAPILSGLVAQGWAPQVSARVWASQWSSDYGTGNDFSSSIRLDLAEPHMLVPANTPPGEPHRMLPPGGSIQVTGEEQHLDALAPWLRPEGECWVHVTLHEVTEQLARSTRTVVEIRLDGSRVGQLTPKMSGELLPAIRLLSENGLVAGARAIVKGNRIKTEVVLYVARAHELPESWLTTIAADAAKKAAPAPMVAAGPPSIPAAAPVQEHGSIPPAPTGIKFVVPPDWPQPPLGWTPPTGWRPDPTWPPAPYGWQWWIPVWD